MQERTGVSVPLVKESEEDVKVARGVVFAAGSSRGDRKRKRVEIQTQSVFKEANKRQAHTALVKACSQMDKSVFGMRPGNETYFVLLRAVFLVSGPSLLLPL